MALHKIAQDVSLIVNQTAHLVAAQQSTTHTVASLAQVVHSIRSSPCSATVRSDSDADSGDEIVQPPAKKIRIARQVSMAGFVTGVVTASEEAFAWTDMTMSATNIGKLLFNYYGRTAFLQPEPEVDRPLMLVVAKLVCYCKRFLPAKTVIAVAPNPLEFAKFQSWNDSMVTLCDRTELALHNFIAARKDGTQKRHDLRRLHATIKYLAKVPIDEFPPLPVGIVENAVEMARSQNLQVYSYRDIDVFHGKREGNGQRGKVNGKG